MQIRIQFQIQGFDDKKLKKIDSWKFVLYFLVENCNLLIPKASLKDAQATGEVFDPQKRTSSATRHENSELFFIFVGHFALLDPDSQLCF